MNPYSKFTKFADDYDIRDKIAIKAMQVMLPEFRFSIDELAEKSYQIADAMLKARKNENT